MVFRLFQFCAFVITLALFLWLAGAFSYFVSMQKKTTLYPDLQTDAIVVLTGGEGRIQKGLELWSQLKAPELFITGVNKTNSRKAVLNSWKGQGRLPLCCLTLDFEATTTRENAQQTRQWVDRNYIKSIRLVTSNYHMRRAIMEFEELMPDITIIKHNVISKEFGLAEPYFWFLFLQEYNKSLVRRLEIETGYELIRRNK